MTFDQTVPMIVHMAHNHIEANSVYDLILDHVVANKDEPLERTPGQIAAQLRNRWSSSRVRHALGTLRDEGWIKADEEHRLQGQGKPWKPYTLNRAIAVEIVRLNREARAIEEKKLRVLEMEGLR